MRGHKRLTADERTAITGMAAGPSTLMSGTYRLLARRMAREAAPLITAGGAYQRYELTRRGESVAVQLRANEAARSAGRPLPGQPGAEPFAGRAERLRRFGR